MVDKAMVRHGSSVGKILLTLVSAAFAVLLLQDPVQAQVATVEKEGPEAVLARQDFTYTIRVTNDPTPDQNVVLEDVLDEGVDLNGPLPTGCTSTEAANVITVRCNLGALAANATKTIALNVEAPDTPGPITNRANVNGVFSNEVITRVSPSADLVVTKRANPNPVPVGDNLSFTLEVTNRGPQDATDVRLRDDLPGNVILISVEEEQGNCFERAGQVVDCRLGDIEAGESATVRVVVEPEEAGTIRNTARVSSDLGDPTPANNTATVSVTAEGDAPGTNPPGNNPPGNNPPGTNPPGANPPGNGGGGTGTGTERDEEDIFIFISGDDNEIGDVIDETIPEGKVLPFTGGIGGDAAGAVVLLGGGALVLLGALLVRFVRFRGL